MQCECICVCVCLYTVYVYLCHCDNKYIHMPQVALATFGTFVATSDEPLTAERAFVALSLFNILSLPLVTLPILISMMVQASVSMTRLSTFLQHDEIDPDNLETREQAAFGMYYSDVNINGIIMMSLEYHVYYR